MKSCATCWYFPEKNLGGFCGLTGNYAYKTGGLECLAHRYRELGKPCGVWVEVPKMDGPWCSEFCDLNGDGFCCKGWMERGKPGKGCPRYQEEGE